MHRSLLCDVRPTVTFPAADPHRSQTGTELYCLVQGHKDVNNLPRTVIRCSRDPTASRAHDYAGTTSIYYHTQPFTPGSRPTSFTNLSHHRLPSGLRTDSTDFMTGPFLLSISVFWKTLFHHNWWHNKLHNNRITEEKTTYIKKINFFITLFVWFRAAY